MANGEEMKKVLLEVIDKYKNSGSGMFQMGPLLAETVERLNIEKTDTEQVQELLTQWYNLFLNGIVSWGYDIDNRSHPLIHMTDKGRGTLKNLSRDPANPEGYIKHLASLCSPVNPISISYIEEALRTYNNNCYKASAVMLGAASENIILEFRDVLVSQMGKSGKTVPADLNGWLIKKVIDKITAEIESKKADIPKLLYGTFSTFWQSLSGLIRIARNDAGHPNSIDPVTEESVHASLLLFPDLAKLIFDLKNWVSAEYK